MTSSDDRRSLPPAAPLDERGNLIGRLLPFIAHRRLEPGDRLPSERELAERFGVGRGAVREALAVLETLRMVERRPNSGIYLRSVERQGSIEAMVLQAELGVPLAESEVREVVELRRIMEIQGVRLAASRRHTDDIQRLDTILAEGAWLVALGENLADYDAAFHLAMVEATGNHVFLRVVNAFYLMSRNRRWQYFADGMRAPLSHQQHVAMRDAVAAGDPDAAEAAMGSHLQSVEGYWLELLKRRSRGD
ncbi:DNA-binding FadR family transcriptional regulator [Humitalea rosea]|uniref:DNA-binding FadR family transcriptional regulator n=1 Tax=Humitalea rosea TaxID=990373 RepID=A0A2W7IX30_9PROT|nr:FadR/GntR family transcriptional regulator [Humitalea rosea]PZW50490.1 DNA-binding FadR family transcriptional regulator [Humitalea rosea]